MSAIVRRAEHRDTQPICELLHTKMNSRIPVQRWRQLMEYRWLSEKPDFGRVVESEGQILGFCGMVYADRTIGIEQREERVVSMSSWYLDKTLRGQGLGKAMLVSAIEDNALTYVTLTNSHKPLGIVEALGFRRLEEGQYLWRKGSPAGTPIRIIENVAEIKKLVGYRYRQIIDDMSGYAVDPILLLLENKELLVFLSIKRKDKDIVWFDLMYASDLTVFVDHAQVLANTLLPDQPSVLAADSRFVSNACEFAEYRQLPVSRYFISQRMVPAEIDHLYSELQLLDLKLD